MTGTIHSKALANNTAMGVNNMRARVIFFALLEQDALDQLRKDRSERICTFHF